MNFERLIEKGIQLTEENLQLKKDIKMQSEAFNQLLDYTLNFTKVEDSEILQDIIALYNRSQKSQF